MSGNSGHPKIETDGGAGGELSVRDEDTEQRLPKPNTVTQDCKATLYTEVMKKNVRNNMNHCPPVTPVYENVDQFQSTKNVEGLMSPENTHAGKKVSSLSDILLLGISQSQIPRLPTEQAIFQPWGCGPGQGNCSDQKVLLCNLIPAGLKPQDLRSSEEEEEEEPDYCNLDPNESGNGIPPPVPQKTHDEKQGRRPWPSPTPPEGSVRKTPCLYEEEREEEPDYCNMIETDGLLQSHDPTGHLPTITAFEKFNSTQTVYSTPHSLRTLESEMPGGDGGRHPGQLPHAFCPAKKFRNGVCMKPIPQPQEDEWTD
nr:PREDICTED: uncharacterized protein LOC106707086 [Latimeria chalumnae]|eukprot:XP_014354384.1 PREDICTED: uncharacterized protein LOC106707086 [Latimeria chalumnae]